MSGLPIVAYAAALGSALVRRRWRRMGILVAGALLAAILIGAMMLSSDSAHEAADRTLQLVGMASGDPLGSLRDRRTVAAGTAGAGSRAVCFAAVSPWTGRDLRLERTPRANLARNGRLTELSRPAVRDADGQ